jgi:hypothetical protein
VEPVELGIPVPGYPGMAGLFAIEAPPLDAFQSMYCAASAPALPVVFWLNVGKFVSKAALTAGSWPLELSWTRLLAPEPTV